MAQAFFNLRDMEQPFYIQFDREWFDPGSIDNILMAFDAGEEVPLRYLKEACEREGTELIIEFIDKDETDNSREL